MECRCSGGFQKISDKFVDEFLTKDDESVEDAKKRIAKEQEEREQTMKADMIKRQQKQQDMIKESIEKSRNAGLK